MENGFIGALITKDARTNIDVNRSTQVQLHSVNTETTVCNNVNKVKELQ